VYWLKTPMSANGHTYGAGSFYIEGANDVVQKAAREIGLDFDGTAAPPSAGAVKLKTQRIALWDQYGGSMPSGHTRWLLEQYEFPYDVVYPQGFDAGNLRSKYDVLVFVTGAIPAPRRQGGGELSSLTDFFGRQPRPEDVPAQYRPWLGRVTADKTIPQLRTFLNDGGTIITIGTSTNLAYQLGLPVRDQLVERTPTGEERELPREKFYVPGSVLQVAVDSTSPVAAGVGSKVDVFFDDSPTFRLEPDAAMRGVHPVAWYDSDQPLRSGWAWGQNYLEGGVAIAEANYGKGKVYLFGPEILFRGQPAGTFKFFFNGIYAGAIGDGGTARAMEDR
jgi:hypothetical protein